MVSVSSLSIPELLIYLLGHRGVARYMRQQCSGRRVRCIMRNIIGSCLVMKGSHYLAGTFSRRRASPGHPLPHALARAGQHSDGNGILIYQKPHRTYAIKLRSAFGALPCIILRRSPRLLCAISKTPEFMADLRPRCA